MKAPPLLVSFSSADEFLRALSPELRELHAAEVHWACSQGLPPICSIRCLGTLFGVSARFVGALASRPERHYRTFVIKKGKKKRTIHAPRVGLKVIQKWMGHHLASSLQFDSCVFGFAPGRSAVQGSARHCGASWVYNVDIADFFPSIPKTQVIDALTRIGYSNRSASIVADLGCFGGALSQGSPASPVLSNLVFQPSDAKLMSLASQLSLTYTRYADDITFSGRAVSPVELPDQIGQIVAAGGWSIAKSKTRMSRRPARLKVYGLLVDGSTPRLTKGYRNQLRAFRHLLAKGTIPDEDSRRFRGHLAYEQSVLAWRSDPSAGN